MLQVNQQGETSPLPAAEPGWDLEISLDVETAHELCQNCKIDLVEARTSSLLNLDTAEQEAVKLGATEISNSWGTNREPLRETLDNADFNHPHIAVVAAAGDNGYRRFGFPGSSPYVIAAGGTTLNLTQTRAAGTAGRARKAGAAPVAAAAATSRPSRGSRWHRVGRQPVRGQTWRGRRVG